MTIAEDKRRGCTTVCGETDPALPRLDPLALPLKSLNDVREELGVSGSSSIGKGPLTADISEAVEKVLVDLLASLS